MDPHRSSLSGRTIGRSYVITLKTDLSPSVIFFSFIQLVKLPEQDVSNMFLSACLNDAGSRGPETACGRPPARLDLSLPADSRGAVARVILEFDSDIMRPASLPRAPDGVSRDRAGFAPRSPAPTTIPAPGLR